MSIKRSIEQAAGTLGIPPRWLDELINFETAGTYDPMAANPNSSARGLIQVINSTARDVFGVPDSTALVNRYPDFDSQMQNVVIPYLERYKPFPTKQSLFMAVFYPAARYWEPTDIFPQWVTNANPGIRTPADYIRKAEAAMNKETLNFPEQLAVPVAIAILAGAAIAYFRKR